MKKLLTGILDFRLKRRAQYTELFGKLSLEQNPDTLLIACSDSRVVPNLFASTDPGDMFVVRNVGNLVPEYGSFRGSVGAAIEFAVDTLKVQDIIICGHSNCGAIKAIVDEDKFEGDIASWLSNGFEIRKLSAPAGNWNHYDLASQTNTLLQTRRLKKYPSVIKALKERKIRIHSWWFNISNAEILHFDKETKSFVVLDENEIKRLIDQLK
jgi:carbonic anhydrase